MFALSTVSKDILIGDLVEQYPETVPVLLEFGIHCVGCHASPYETLEQGMKGHGMSDEDVNSALEKLNAALAEKAPEVPVIEGAKVTFSETGEQMLKQFLVAEKKTALRLHVKVGGCAGSTYVFDLVDKGEEGDYVFEQNGAKLFVAQDSMEKVNGSTIEYKHSLTDAGFKVTNPQAQATCGCGISFK